MIEITRREDCSGCTACSHICPVGAITMREDDLGFKYPVVDKERCVKCGACVKVCVWNGGYDTSNDSMEVYAARHRVFDSVMRSQSGGVFGEIAQHYINLGGVVYGAQLDENFRAVHARGETQEECEKFRGSKYVQSDLGDTFIKVREDLKAGRDVLFGGTPCQVASLKKFLEFIPTEKLLLCDLVCHGTPSPAVWRGYLDYSEKKYGEKVVAARFRDKEKGWREHVESLTFESGHKVFSTVYTFLFYREIMQRPSCSSCRFTNTVRAGDITLADYWGIERVDSSFASDNRGCSLVMVSTAKGKELFGKVSESFEVLPTTLQEAMACQPHLKRPIVPSRFSRAFERDFIAHGFEYVARRYGNIGVRYRTKRTLRTIRKLPGNTYRRLFK